MFSNLARIDRLDSQDQKTEIFQESSEIFQGNSGIWAILDFWPWIVLILLYDVLV